MSRTTRFPFVPVIARGGTPGSTASRTLDPVHGHDRDADPELELEGVVPRRSTSRRRTASRSASASITSAPRHTGRNLAASTTRTDSGPPSDAIGPGGGHDASCGRNSRCEEDDQPRLGLPRGLRGTPRRSTSSTGGTAASPTGSRCGSPPRRHRAGGRPRRLPGPLASPRGLRRGAGPVPPSPLAGAPPGRGRRPP